MKSGQQYLLALVCLLLLSLTPAVKGQNRSGDLQRNRYRGYVPKHEKVLRAQAQLENERKAQDRGPNPFQKPVEPFDQTLGSQGLEAPILPTSSSVSKSSIQQASHFEPLPAPPAPVTSSSMSAAANGGSQFDSVSHPQAAIIEQPITGTVEGLNSACESSGRGLRGWLGHGASCNCWQRSPGSPCTTMNPCYGPMYWISADYVFWGLQGIDTPAWATTSPSGTDRELAGVLGEPDTSVVYGNTSFHEGLRVGNRFTAGMWLTQARTAGLQVSYVSIETDNESFSGGVVDFPILARPFFNIQLNEEDSRLINFTGVVTGTLTMSAQSDFSALDVMLFRPLSYPSGYLRLFGGYRHVELDESIRFEESTTSLESPTLDSTFDLFDVFQVQNDFHGAQLAAHYVRPLNRCWSYDILGKAALGGTRTVTTVDGETTITTDGGDTSTQQGGLLALDSNIGEFTDVKFSSVFEFGISLRRTFRNGLHFTVGYNFLHWSNVARAVEQIDLDVNPTQIPPDTMTGQPRPRNRFKRGGLWAQGLNLGLEYRW